MRAGVVVTAASAWSAVSPRPMARATLARKLFTSLSPLAVSANAAPARARAAGLPGAWFQWRSSSVETSIAVASSPTSGVSGKLTGTMSGNPAAAIGLRRLYSSPAPRIAASTPASRAMAPARSTSSISSATNNAGCRPATSGSSAAHDRFSSGRGLPAGDRA